MADSLPSTLSIDALHKSALDQGLDSYIDPKTGYGVFTSQFLQRRGKCCGSGCRHCPFAHRNVPAARQVKLEQDPYIIGADFKNGGDEKWSCTPDIEDDHASPRTSSTPCRAIVLFWSGGKDSLLAYYTLKRKIESESRDGESTTTAATMIVLLSTFDGRSEFVANQEVPFDLIRRQAKALRCPLVAVPLYPGREYVDRLALALEALRRRLGVTIASLAFGDLHLDHIRQWRESALCSKEFSLEFPLWHLPYDSLMDTLFTGVMPDLHIQSIKVSAVPHESPAAGVVEVGDDYCSALVEKIRAWNAAHPERTPIDVMGENGDFHSAVEFEQQEEGEDQNGDG